MLPSQEIALGEVSESRGFGATMLVKICKTDISQGRQCCPSVC